MPQNGMYAPPADDFTGGPVSAYGPPDPTPPGALPYADILNPQSLNKYQYALNNPFRYIDPTGHDECDRIPGCAMGKRKLQQPPSPESEPAYYQSMASQQVNTLTVGQVGNIVANEHVNVGPGEAGQGQLNEAKRMTADAVINGDMALGGNRPPTAPENKLGRTMSPEEYQEAQTIAGQAYYNRFVQGGSDSADGRMYFNHRVTESKLNDPSSARKIGNKMQTVHAQRGPFRSARPYWVLYNDPGK